MLPENQYSCGCALRISKMGGTASWKKDIFKEKKIYICQLDIAETINDVKTQLKVSFLKV